MCIWHWLKKPVFFTIQLIFAIIHRPHCIFWYYSWIPLYYFSYLLTLPVLLSIKSFQFQLNKLFLNRHLLLFLIIRMPSLHDPCMFLYLTCVTSKTIWFKANFSYDFFMYKNYVIVRSRALGLGVTVSAFHQIQQVVG